MPAHQPPSQTSSCTAVITPLTSPSATRIPIQLIRPSPTLTPYHLTSPLTNPTQSPSSSSPLTSPLTHPGYHLSHPSDLATPLTCPPTHRFTRSPPNRLRLSCAIVGGQCWNDFAMKNSDGNPIAWMRTNILHSVICRLNCFKTLM